MIAKEKKWDLRALSLAALGAIVLASPLNTAMAQDFSDLKAPASPLSLKAQGSFYVGGERVNKTAVEGNAGAGTLTINQMYVEYMVPKSNTKVPVVLVEGSTLSGKSWETTPDGRMGWDEYFVRKGYAVYVADQVSRGRSGFDPSVYNNVRAGLAAPNTQPAISRADDERAWRVWRIGPSLGVPFSDSRFIAASANELSKQNIPDLNRTLPTPNPTYKAMSDLAIKLQGAVLIGHSQAGTFPMQAALVNSAGAKGLVLMEPTGCPFTDAQTETIKNVPILVVFGDHLDADTGLPGFSWRPYFDQCVSFINRVNAAGGNAKMLYPPDLKIYGNTHLLMMDNNSLQIADLVMNWISKNVKYKKSRR